MEKDKEKRILIAVYGSLLEGLHNHRLISDAHYVGDFTTDGFFTMYDLGSFPAITSTGNSTIEMSVYAVNEKEAKDVDRLEGYEGENSNNNFYEKGTIVTPFGTAFYYYMKGSKLQDSEVVESGDWKDHYTTKI